MRSLKYTSALKTVSLVNLILGGISAIIIFFTASFFKEALIAYMNELGQYDAAAVEIVAQAMGGVLIFTGIMIIVAGLIIYLIARKADNGAGPNIAILVLSILGGTGVINIILIVYSILNISDNSKRQSEVEFQEPPKTYQ